MRIRAVLLSTVIGVTPGIFAQNGKQPWALTLEERIALRTDAVLARERVRANGRVRTTAGDTPLLADSFDGKSHPDLFTPQQVYRTLISMAYLNPPDGGERFRKVMMGEVADSGLPFDFWDRFSALSADYLTRARAERQRLAAIRQLQGNARGDAQRVLRLEQMELCSSAADTLAAIRREFGPSFDRFLYTAIAVHMFHTADELPKGEDLRKIERGCR
jgi:hypothetical protein